MWAWPHISHVLTIQLIGVTYTSQMSYGADVSLALIVKLPSLVSPHVNSELCTKDLHISINLAVCTTRKCIISEWPQYKIMTIVI